MASGPDLSRSSFLEAIDAFKSKSGLTSKELFDMEMTTLLDLQKALGAVQQKQQDSKKQRFLARLKPFLDAMQQYSKVINVFANTSDIIAFVWVCFSCGFDLIHVDSRQGPMKLLLVVSFSSLVDALLPGIDNCSQRSHRILQRPSTPCLKVI